jgi:putative redox protein
MSNVSFPNDHGLQLAGIMDGEGKKGVVICSHFTGFKEVKHYYRLAKALAEESIAALRFDFSDCIGASGGSCEDMKLTHQVRDVFAAIDFMEEQGVKSIGVMGHSLGGTTAVVASANDTRVKALVPVAALAKLEWDTLFKSKVDEWRSQGYITFPSWKRGEIKIKYGFYKDLAKYDATQLIKAVKAPVRVIHPGEDELVPLRNAQGLYENANEPKDLQIVEGADHMFSKPEHEERMVSLCVEWFKRYL